MKQECGTVAKTYKHSTNKYKYLRGLIGNDGWTKRLKTEVGKQYVLSGRNKHHATVDYEINMGIWWTSRRKQKQWQITWKKSNGSYTKVLKNSRIWTTTSHFYT